MNNLIYEHVDTDVFTGWQMNIDIYDEVTGETVRIDLTNSTATIPDAYVQYYKGLKEKSYV